MNVASRVVGIALLWTLAGIAPAVAQQQQVDGGATVQVSEEEDRAALRGLLARAEVQRAAQIGGLDLNRIEEGIPQIEGDQLHRAAQQARAIESRLGEQGSAQRISFEVTTLIIIALLIIVIILVA
jgi:hypothetical protein